MIPLLHHEPAQIINSIATILVQVITNSYNFVKGASITPPFSTNDHCTVGVCLSFKGKKKPEYQHVLWNYKQADFQAFRNALSETTFDKYYSTGDVDDACTK